MKSHSKRVLFNDVLFSVALFLLQIFAIDAMSPIHGLINVYVYYFPILFLVSLNTSLYVLMGIALFLGWCMDMVYDSLGLFMLSALWVAYVQHRLVRMLFSSRKLKLISTERIGLHVMPFSSLLTFLVIVAGAHQLVLMVLESFSLQITYHFLLKFLLDTAYSSCSLLVFYLLYHHVVRKSMHR